MRINLLFSFIFLMVITPVVGARDGQFIRGMNAKDDTPPPNNLNTPSSQQSSFSSYIYQRFLKTTNKNPSLNFPSLNLRENEKLRILILQIDNRELEPQLDGNTSYPSLTAVLNYNYAKLHGYDYRYYHPYMNVEEVEKKYNVNPPDFGAGNEDGRSQVTAFHASLKEFRGASWSKLPLLWHVATTSINDYDLVMYLDSDSSITNAKSSRSIEKALLEWIDDQENGGGKRVVWGEMDLQRTAMIFFPNSPFGEWEPCAGAFLFRPQLAAPIIKTWWDYDLPDKNFALAHEQDVLWLLFQFQDQWKYSLNMSSTSMVKENQFPPHVDQLNPKENLSNWCLQDGWMCHICSIWGRLRKPIFRRMLGVEEKELGDMSKHPAVHGYRKAIESIKETEVQFNIVAAAEAMAVPGSSITSYKERNVNISSGSFASSKASNFVKALRNVINNSSKTDEDVFRFIIREIPL